jgi:hypothetical protein
MEKVSPPEQGCLTTCCMNHDTSIPEKLQKHAEELSPAGLLRSKEFTMSSYLTAKQRSHRVNLLGWWIGNARDSLQLRNRTIDMAIRIFDLYCHKQYQKIKETAETSSKSLELVHTLDNFREGKLTATTCFFSAAKFYEVYPPSLQNFIHGQEDCLTKHAVIEKELELMVTIDCRYDVALITDWFDLYS